MLLFIKIFGLISFTVFCWSIPMMKNAKIADWQKGIKFFKISFTLGLALSAICGATYWYLTNAAYNAA
ncbi:MAG: hypothetical protein COC00_002745 [Rhizobiales bacterium]|nr:hypothetical protein [Hyphomicrobiales bacterium]